MNGVVGDSIVAPAVIVVDIELAPAADQLLHGDLSVHRGGQVPQDVFQESGVVDGMTVAHGQDTQPLQAQLYAAVLRILAAGVVQPAVQRKAVFREGVRRDRFYGQRHVHGGQVGQVAKRFGTHLCDALAEYHGGDISRVGGTPGPLAPHRAGAGEDEGIGLIVLVEGEDVADAPHGTAHVELRHQGAQLATVGGVFRAGDNVAVQLLAHHVGRVEVGPVGLVDQGGVVRRILQRQVPEVGVVRVVLELLGLVVGDVDVLVEVVLTDTGVLAHLDVRRGIGVDGHAFGVDKILIIEVDGCRAQPHVRIVELILRAGAHVGGHKIAHIVDALLKDEPHHRAVRIAAGAAPGEG